MRPVELPRPLHSVRRVAWTLFALGLVEAAVGARQCRLDGPPLVAGVHFALALVALGACRTVWRRAPKRPCDRLFRWRDDLDAVA